MRAREWNLLETQYRVFPTVIAKNNLVFPDESALGDALLPAEPVHAWFCWSQGRGRRVICVQHGTVGFRLILENARFGAGISFQRVMAVQVVGCKVQEDADVGAKCFNQLQLKTA